MRSQPGRRVAQAVTQLGRLSGVHQLDAGRVAHRPCAGERTGRLRPPGLPPPRGVPRHPTAASRSATSAATTARTSTASRSGRPLLGPNDIVGVGHSTFRLVGDRLEEFVDTGEVSFSARHLTVTVDGGKQILKDVSFGVPEKSLIAVIGPSGSGKSTLLKALTGYRPADQGESSTTTATSTSSSPSCASASVWSRRTTSCTRS